MTRVRRTLAAAMLTACGLAGMGAAPAAAATGALLPHPGAEGLVWVGEMTGDGGVASGGAWEKLPTILTVACEGGGSVQATMRQQSQVAAFTVDCPSGSVGVGSVTMDAGVMKAGSFTVGIDASDESIRWGLTVTQPE